MRVCRLLFKTQWRLRSLHRRHGGPCSSIRHFIYTLELAIHSVCRIGILNLLLAACCASCDFSWNSRNSTLVHRQRFTLGRCRSSNWRNSCIVIGRRCQASGLSNNSQKLHLTVERWGILTGACTADIGGEFAWVLERFDIMYRQIGRI